MNVINLYDLDKTRPLPSLQFLFRKKQSALNRLKREISIKEYQFKHCSWIEDIQKRIYEKELGELYAELMTAFKKTINTSGF